MKSARGVSFTLSFLMMLSKPLGYVRTLIIAWAFGTSAGIDAYHVANVIVALFAEGLGIAIESAVLPEMVRVRKELGDESGSRALLAVITRIVFFLTVLLCAAFAIAPGVLIRIFASGFDAERIRMGAVMIWCLLPFTVTTMTRPLAGTWALFNEKYTLSSICGMAFNFVAIPTLLLLIPVIGVYSVAVCMSAANLVTLSIFLVSLRGVPVRTPVSLIPPGSLSKVGLNVLFSLLITSSGTLYLLVDRYFASRLPAGSVAAIGYGGSILLIMNAAVLSPLSFFLAKISRLVTENLDEAENAVRQSVALAIAYILPACFIAAAAARPLISLVYGWGNFDARSVDMTATCLAGYSLGMVFAVGCNILYRFAQARQRLGRITPLLYVSVCVNALLNWILVTRFGLLGLALATSLAQIISFVIYYKSMMGYPLGRFLIRSKFFHQLALVSVCAILTWKSGGFGAAAQCAAAVALFAAYLFAAEAAGFMPHVPEHWRPKSLLAFLSSSLRSFAKN
ncbi:MAG: polysaccharide biosynthesis C-terminal domain-containing protein [Synergistaceae bacterium]|nr:polysaccharide biosynthesis C-terminal domain-containing protein [Synergistaceae bacterium]